MKRYCATKKTQDGPFHDLQLWGMSQTPGIISLGQHIAGESQGISRTDFPSEESWKVLTGAQRRDVRT